MALSRYLRNAGIKVIPVVASVAMAKLMERAGADAVIAEGMEAGGHIGNYYVLWIPLPSQKQFPSALPLHPAS